MTMTHSQELATTTPGTLAIRPGQDMWNDKQRAALQVLGIKGATNADLAVFMHYCQKTGLDPFSRQIYMICRREKQGDQWVDKQTIQVGIDGFRVIRDRIAARLGLSVEYEDTIWYDDSGAEWKVWIWDEPPAACKVTVIRDGKRFPAVVRTAAYAATNKSGDLVAQWRTQPEHMIEKCAEAFALRRAFPHDLGGLYVEDELPPADEAPARAQRVTAADITAGRPAANGHAPATADVPDPAVPDETPGSGPAAGPGAPRFRRLTKPTLGKLKGTLLSLPLGGADERAMVLAALAGRPVKLAESLSQDEAEDMQTLLDRALENAGGDKEAAGAAVWDTVRALLATQAQDDDAERVPDGSA